MNEFSLKRVFVGIVLGLFLVFALALTTQCKERLVDVNTLMGVKTPPADAFWNWQAVSCGDMSEGECDEEDLVGASAFLVALDDNGNCHAKKYLVALSNDPQLLNLQINPNLDGVIKIVVKNLNWTWVGCLTDGNPLEFIGAWGICHGNGGDDDGDDD